MMKIIECESSRREEEFSPFHDRRNFPFLTHETELSWVERRKKKVQKWIIDFNSPNSQRTSESAQTLLSTDKQKHQAEENRRKMTIIHNLLVRKNCLALLIIILSTFNSLLLSENASILLPQASTTAQTTPHACADDFSPTKKAHP